MFCENFKDTYVALNGDVCFFDANTLPRTENEVIKAVLSPVLSGVRDDAIKEIRFLPFSGEAEQKIEHAFGDVCAEAEDAYLVEVRSECVTVYANGTRGFLYGACTLYSHYRNGIREGYIYNVPLVDFRAAKLYLPAEDKMEEFYYLLDLLMHYGYNAVVLEVGGAMVYEKHPEINEYWKEVCRDLSEYSGKATMLQNSMPWGKNSIHIENGGGGVLSKRLVKEICDYARAHGLEPIPEVPSLSHADYLLAGRAELAERPNDPYPDTYCPSNPKCYEILFDVLDEVIEVFVPKVVHIGHDEYYVFGVCDKCKQKRGAEIYAQDVAKIHEYLASRGIRTMLWGEKLLNSYNKKWNSAGGARYTHRYSPSGRFLEFRGKRLEVQNAQKVPPYEVPLLPQGTVYTTVEETYSAIGMIPKDVIAMNWYYSYYELGDLDYHYHGIPMVYGNFSGLGFQNWKGRVAMGAKGFAVSSWGASDFKQMQRGARIANLVYASRMAWSREYDETQQKRELEFAAASVFDHRFRAQLEGNYVEIVHTADFVIPHGYFGCGDFLDDDMFRLGYYRVYYRDGTGEAVEILWGENVGASQLPLSDGNKAFSEDGVPHFVSIMSETVFTCDFEKKGEKNYYRFVIPTQKEVDHVEPEIFEQYKDKLIIDRIVIHNKI